MNPKEIIIHCSDSDFGTLVDIDSWHRERGFDQVGYHYVITNPRPDKDVFMISLDGHANSGRALDKKGAHCYGHNSDTIGICLVGKDFFTNRQLETAKELVTELMFMHNIGIANVKGHYEYDKGKTCPNIDMNLFRRYVVDNAELADFYVRGDDV
jgi:hypothetical protein